jgi:tetratricopeptide (TPR) repeat protein
LPTIFLRHEYPLGSTASLLIALTFDHKLYSMTIFHDNTSRKHFSLMFGLFLLALAPLNAVNAAAQDELASLVESANQLQNSGQHQAAYELMLANEFDGAGDIDFDYLLGIAAIDSGHPDQAIFVLLRVLNQKPKHSGARMELGRAYYANGDLLDAKAQFDVILQQNPPAAAKALSEQYLTAIKTQLAANLSSLVQFIDFKAGYTTNANGATGNQQPFRGLAGVPAAVQELSLDANSVEKSSMVLSLNTGLSYSEQFIPRWYAKAGAQVNLQVNPSAHFVDTHGVGGYASVEKRLAESYKGVGVDLAKNYVDHQFSNSVIGLNLIAGDKLTKRWSGIAQLRFAGSNFPQPAKDSIDYTIALNASRAPVGPKQIQYTAGVIGQRISAAAAVNSKDVKGLSAGVVMLPLPATLLSISAAYIDADFDAPVLGTAERNDKTIILGVGAIRPSKVDPNLKWSLRVDVNETRSTLNLFDADALKLTLGARYDFQ